MQQKGFSIILVVLGVVAALALVSGGYYYGTKKAPTLEQTVSQQNPVIFPSPGPTSNKPTLSGKPSFTDTSNWLTATNGLYAYSIKYPSDYQRQPLGAYHIRNGQSDADMVNTDTFYGGTKGKDAVSIVISSYTDYAKPSDLLDKLNSNTGENIEVAGQKVKKVVLLDGLEEIVGPILNETRRHIFVYLGSTKESNPEIFHKMLTTFDVSYREK